MIMVAQGLEVFREASLLSSLPLQGGHLIIAAFQRLRVAIELPRVPAWDNGSWFGMVWDVVKGKRACHGCHWALDCKASEASLLHREALQSYTRGHPWSSRSSCANPFRGRLARLFN